MGFLERFLFAVALILGMVVSFAGALVASEGDAVSVVPAGLDWKSLAIVAFLAAPIAMVVTQMGKKALARLNPDCPGDPFWWQWGLRVLSIVAGAGAGMLLLSDAVAWGAMAGACGGILSSVIVATLRKQIRGLTAPPPEA